MKKDITFYSEGSKIAGHLYLPEKADENNKVPAVVLCHGFAGIKELLLPVFAEKFAKQGYASLVFDYRGFGESEGERGRLVPVEQVRDIRNALTYMQTVAEVDQEQLFLWGTSFGGANAITTASIDSRVKALCVQLTFGSGERVITGSMTDEEKAKLFATFEKVEKRAVTTNKPMMLKPVQILTDEQSKEFYTSQVEKFPALAIKIPLVTIKYTIEYKPEDVLDKVNVPLLIIGAANDRVNPPEESQRLFDKAKEPKELMILENTGHYECYEGESFEKISDKALEWFKTYG